MATRKEEVSVEDLQKELAALRKEVAALKKELGKKSSGGVDPRVDKIWRVLEQMGKKSWLDEA